MMKYTPEEKKILNKKDYTYQDILDAWYDGRFKLFDAMKQDKTRSSRKKIAQDIEKYARIQTRKALSEQKKVIEAEASRTSKSERESLLKEIRDWIKEKYKYDKDLKEFDKRFGK